MRNESKKALIEIYTDGSASTSDGPAGWAFRIVGNASPLYEASGFMERATNNDAELEAAIQGLEFIKNKYEISQRNPSNEDIFLVSDSQIILGWASGKYKARQKEKVEKVKKLRYLVKKIGAKLRWVRGHSGDTHNVRCDKLAKSARKGDTANHKIETRTMIGRKEQGVICVWYKNVLKVVDLETNLVENYDAMAHGPRTSKIELRSEDE